MSRGIFACIPGPDWLDTLLWRETLPVPRHHFFVSHDQPTEQMANPFEFLQEVRAEGSKVTWPNRRETTITTVLVIIMCILASLFLFSVDQVIHLAINLVLGLR